MPHTSHLKPKAPLPPTRVIPPSLADAVDRLPHWFVIGGHAVRCLCPYRPSRDVDFGVGDARSMEDLLAALTLLGTVETIEASSDTVHIRWNGIDVSIFVLASLVPFVEERRLGLTGMLATKLHAILDRGTRRDFFDLYVLLQLHRCGIIECLRAMRDVYGPGVKEGLLLRALTYFADAEREALLAGEGRADWHAVKDFFQTRVGNLLVPPETPLQVQSNFVDVSPKAVT